MQIQRRLSVQTLTKFSQRLITQISMAEQRLAQFNTYMDKFANMDEIARLVLGSYGRGIDADLKEEYTSDVP